MAIVKTTTFVIENFSLELEFNDYNDVHDCVFRAMECPLCHKINHNLTFFQFSESDEDFNELFMLDNDLDDLDLIIRCHACGMFLKLALQDCTTSSLVFLKLKMVKRKKKRIL